MVGLKEEGCCGQWWWVLEEGLGLGRSWAKETTEAFLVVVGFVIDGERGAYGCFAPGLRR